jgi:hypothetical protein
LLVTVVAIAASGSNTSPQYGNTAQFVQSRRWLIAS